MWRIYAVTGASLASYLAVLWFDSRSLPQHFYLTITFFVMFFAGWLGYYLFFEWGWHRFVMHYQFRFQRPKFLAAALRRMREDHLLHHASFYGKHFTSRDPKRMENVISPAYLFPLLFFAHRALFGLIFPPLILAGFLAGITWGYILFENIHWCTHVPGTFLDRTIGCAQQVPLLLLLWRWWDYMKRHHHLHHEEVEKNFNFSIPFPGDVAFGTFRPAPDDFSEYEKE